MRKYQQTKLAHLVCKTMAVGGVGLVLLCVNAPAQDTTNTTALPAVIVTGSMIPTAETVGPSPVAVVSAEKIQSLGSADILQSLKKVEPSLSGNLNVGQEVNNGGFGESTVAIRNQRTLVLLNGHRLGNSSFSNGQLVDLNTIPLAAIERVEVLKDGASALYGSEAIGGVVNIITKKEFSGVEIGGRYGAATGKGNYYEAQASIVGGTATERSWFMAAAQYYHQDPLKSTDRKPASLGVIELADKGVTPPSYMSPSFTTRIDEGDYYILAGSPVAAGGSSYNPAMTTPPVTPGTPYPTLAAYMTANPNVYIPLANTPIGQAMDSRLIYPNVVIDPDNYPGGGYPLGAYYGYPVLDTKQFGTHSIQSQDRRNFFGSGGHQLFGKEMEVYGDFLYANIESEGVLAPSPVTGLAAKQSNINIPANNPYNPFQIALGPLAGASGLPPVAPRVRSRFVDSGNRLFDAQTDYYHFVGGLKGEFDSGWGYNGAFTYNRYDQIQYTRNAINGAALDLALQPNGQFNSSGLPLSQLPGVSGQNVPVYNIFGTGGVNSQETLNAIKTTLFQSGVSEQWDAGGVITGTPLDLPGGKLGVAFGGGFSSESLETDFDGLTRIGKVPGLNAALPTSGRRDSWAGFVEVRIPVTSPENDIPGLRNLEVTAAGRYETFDPGGDSAVPKVGIRWQPLDEQITIRGTYSQSFVAPTTYELFGGSAVNVPLLGLPLTTNGPNRLRQEYTSNLSNQDLKPADAENWGVGMVFSPKVIKGLTLSVDYYHIKVENDIFRVSQQSMVNSLNSLGSGSPWTNYFSKADGSRITTTDRNQANDLQWGNLEVPLLNGAETETDGLDLTATYQFKTEKAGNWTFWANANVLLSYQYQDPISGGPYDYNGQYTDAALGIAGAQGTLPDYIINLGLSWEMPIRDDALTFSVNAQYIPPVDSLGSLHPSNLEFENTWDDGLNDYTMSGAAWKVDSWYKIDMQLSYELGKNKQAKSWYDGTRVTVGCNNVTDVTPPLIAGSFEDNTDKSTYDIVGRFIYFEVSKKF